MHRLDHLLEQGSAEAIAIVDRDRHLTYAGLREAVAKAAGALVLRINPGDRVALWLPKSLESVMLMFAVSRAGAILVPVNPVLRPQQVVHILEDSGSAFLITQGARASGLHDAPCSLLLVDELWPACMHSAPLGDEAPGGDALAALYYTSGSTGRPKGVMVTHHNLLVGARSVASYLGTTPDDRVLAVLPFSFDFGFSQLTTVFHSGASVVLLDYLAPRDVVKACDRFEITQMAAVPPLWMQLVVLEWPPTAIERMRTLSNSGGRLPEPIVRALRQLFPDARLHLMYGLTEAFRSTTLPPELADSHPTSIGRAIPDAEILVVRPDGEPTDDDEAGELVHTGPLVTKGYWRDPERTALRYRPAPAHSRYGGPAVWSGDTVVRDAEGLLTFVGRADETIKTMGTRVSPTEIEELAVQSQAVAEAVAFGISDPVAGQRIRLVATPASGLDSAQAEAVLGAYFKREAAPYMQPASIVWTEKLPVSPNGKLDRAMLKGQFGE